MRVVKTNTSRWIHETFDDQASFGWQGGYGAFSVSRSAAGEVEDYIARQEEHHARVSFEDEFAAFLKRYGVEYDPRYLWEGR